MSLRRRGVFAPKILIPLLAAGAVGIGAVGVMSLLARRGEAAISMIPSDALVAVSFDNTPSASQVPLFNEIKAAMDDSGLNDFIDNMLEQFDPKGGTIKRIRSHIKGSFAVGVWGDVSGGKPDMIMAIALNDPAGAENLLSSVPEVRRRVEDGMRYYTSGDAPMVVAFHDDYAIAASSVQAAHKAVDTAEGRVRNLYEEPNFKQARQSLPSDASLMFFMNGRAMAEADEDTKQLYKSMGVSPEGWMAFGVTLRNEGIVINSYEPTETSAAFKQELMECPELTYRSLDKLPGNAVGVFGISSPSAIAQMIQRIIGATPNGSDMDKGIAEMEKDSGTDFEKDWLPAFKGELFVALYPPVTGEKEPGVIVSIDSSNGGDPAALAQKIIGNANSGKYDKSGHNVHLKSETLGNMTLYSSDDKKNDGWLGVTDNQVMLFSKRSLADRTASGSTSKLLETEGISSFTQGDPAQMRMQIDMYRLFDMLESLGEMPKDINLRQILSQRELTMKGHWDDTASVGEILIPINIPELLRVVGKEAKKQQSAAPRPSEFDFSGTPEKVKMN